MQKAEIGCQTCNHQKTPLIVEPCKSCIREWVKKQKHSTGWGPAHTVDNKMGKN